AFTRAMSTRTAPSSITPNSAPRRATCAARALAISVLVGVQPLLTQVPPTSLRSMIAVLRPALPSRTASAGPAWPVPMTIASNARVMRLPPFADERMHESTAAAQARTGRATLQAPRCSRLGPDARGDRGDDPRSLLERFVVHALDLVPARDVRKIGVSRP